MGMGGTLRLEDAREELVRTRVGLVAMGMVPASSGKRRKNLIKMHENLISDKMASNYMGHSYLFQIESF